MTNNDIIKFSENRNSQFKKCMRIDFKNRNSIDGFIIAASDYEHLSSKNLWRIVYDVNLEKWKKSNNLDFAKIYNGTDITRLSVKD